MTWSRLLLFALAMLLAFPMPLTASAPEPGSLSRSAPARAAPAEPGAAAEVAPRAKAAKKNKGKKHKQKKQKQKQKRKNGRQKARKAKRARQQESPEIAETTEERLRPDCPSGMILLPESGLCTHGPDPAPPGVDATERAAPLSKAAVRRATAAVACDGDGVSGPRVQVIYAYSGSPDTDFYPESIRGFAADADAIMQVSATAAGGSRAFRFVMTGECEIDVIPLSFSTPDLNDFDRMIDSLIDRGFDRIDRLYLIFADTTTSDICGIGTWMDDDFKSPANWSNYGPSYARADASFGCWDGHTAAHELMHNLGGVQDSAPFSSRAGHCIDEYDVMCYRDAPNTPPMQFQCLPQGTFEFRFDCNNNTYFDPSPTDSYLTTHWNTADNRFLIGGASAPDDNGDPPAVSWLAPVGNNGSTTVESGTVSLEAAASDDALVNRIEFWRLDASGDWVHIATDRTAPYTASLPVSALRFGANVIAADGYDGALNFTSEEITVTRTGTPPPPPPPPPDPGTPASAAVTITAPGAGARVKAKKWVTLGANVANAPAGALSVEYRVCAGGACTWEAGQSMGTVSNAPFNAGWKAPGKGTFTFLATVTHAEGADVSDPLTISIKKEKKKKR